MTVHTHEETTQVEPEQEDAPGTSGDVIPTAAFLADPRAAVHLLPETVESLCKAYSLQRALVDLSTLPGLVVAAALLQAHVPYEHIDFGQEIPEPLPQDATQPDHRFKPKRPRTIQDLPYLMSKSAGVRNVQLGELASVNANLVLVPAMIGAGESIASAAEPLIDFSPTTIVGAVLDQAERLNRELLVIAPPERGLRVAAVRGVDTSSAERYERQTILVRAVQRS